MLSMSLSDLHQGVSAAQNLTTISTPRLLLRAVELKDAEDLFKCFRDLEVMRYWSCLPHKSISETESWILEMIRNRPNGITDFVMEERVSGTVIGKIGIWQDSEVGFLIARSFWRKGLVSEALDALLPYLFKERGCGQITADVDPRNDACLKILKKYGFVVTGRRDRTFNLGGEWCHSIDLVLKRRAWSKL